MFTRSLCWFVFGNFHATSPTSMKLLLLFVLAAISITAPVSPRIRAILSNSVASESQTKLFSAFSAVESIGHLLSPAFSFGYALTVKRGYPGCMYSIMSSFGLFAFLTLLWVRCKPEFKDNFIAPNTQGALYTTLVTEDSNGHVDEETDSDKIVYAKKMYGLEN